MNPETIVPIGTIGGAHGLGGEVRVKLYNPSSTILVAGLDVYLVGRDGGRREAVIRSARGAGDKLLLSFDGVDDRTSAGELNGVEVAVVRSMLPPTGPGEFYYEDVIGLPVRLLDGEIVGRVSGVMNGATDILVIDRDGAELMVPVVEGFVADVGTDEILLEREALELP